MFLHVLQAETLTAFISRLFFKDTCLAKRQESGTVSHTGVKGKSFYWSHVIDKVSSEA